MSDDPRRFLTYLETERKASLLYRGLAELVEGDRHDALLELADIEDEHVTYWADKLGQHGIAVPPAPTTLDPEDQALLGRARAAGFTDVLKYLEDFEGEGAGMYDNEPEATPQMSADERMHAETFRRMRMEQVATASLPRKAPTPGEGEPWHRGDRSGALRAAVFGISDGLVSNTALVMGFAGAAPSNGTILFAGLAGLFAGAFSMAAGEYVSVASQRDMFRREIALEASELRDKPDEERKELELIYRAKGLDRTQAAEIAARIMANPDTALDTLAREELGLDPDALGSPVKVAISSFIAFAVGACVVVLPYLFFLGSEASTTIPLGLAIVMSLMAMTAVGAVVGRTSGRGVVKGALRQLAVGVGAALVTYLIGRVVGAVTGLNGLG